MKTETVKPQCVVNGKVLLCFIPGEGVIRLTNGRYSIAKREEHFGKPLKKDVWNHVVHKPGVIKREMTAEEIEAATKAMAERADLLSKRAEKQKLKTLRERPRKKAHGRRFR